MSAITNPRPSPAPAPVRPVAPPEHPETSGGKPWLWLSGLVAILIVAGLLYQFWWKPKQEAQQGAGPVATKTVKVTTGPVVKTLRLAGTTASREFANITAPIQRGPESGRELILLYFVSNGARVKKGELLAQIDSKGVEDHIDDIGDDIERAEADIRKRRAEQLIDLENLNQTLRVAKSEWEKALLEAKAAEVRTTIDQELLRLSTEEAEARYKQASADVAFKKAGHAAELRILEITKERHIRHRGR
ncbi:MAG: efflux RND transporter periplasmic adaptor subunit, partial [Bryobacterales bacterium]|nr:efflux RND transporter periplasmic adaptor subunit [Bryobacterales bacterium]